MYSSNSFRASVNNSNWFKTRLIFFFKKYILNTFIPDSSRHELPFDYQMTAEEKSLRS